MKRIMPPMIGISIRTNSIMPIIIQRTIRAMIYFPHPILPIWAAISLRACETIT